MNPLEIERTASAIHRLRPDWRADSLRTFITNNLADRPYRDTVIALAWVATDPACQTPHLATMDGPWWAASQPKGEPPTTPTPPGPERCIVHRNPTPCAECIEYARHIATPDRVRAIRESWA